jgi:AcrR family transcriptional regulator
MAKEGRRTVPTGVALRDARQQLFDAAERVLLRAGPGALTSRAVTTEAEVAKGVLHRHFEDFDAFLAGLVEDRMARIGGQSAALCEAAGTGTVVGNLTGALSDLFGSVAAAIIPLIIFRDELRARLRQARPGGGVPVLAEATAMIAATSRPSRKRAASRPAPTSTCSLPPSSGPGTCSTPTAKARRRSLQPSVRW